MKKPKEFMLFEKKPKQTSILDSIGRSKGDLGTVDKNIIEMDGLFVKGKSKFDSEVEFGLKIPENQRMLVKTKEAIDEQTMRSLNKVIDEEL